MRGNGLIDIIESKKLFRIVGFGPFLKIGKKLEERKSWKVNSVRAVNVLKKGCNRGEKDKKIQNVKHFFFFFFFDKSRIFGEESETGNPSKLTNFQKKKIQGKFRKESG
jgi:hypothetical protein